MSPEETADLKLFEDLLKKRIIPPACYDDSKQEFANMRQGKLTVIKYIRKFSD